MELKDRIEAVRLYANLSASAFAKKLGVKTTQTLYDLLSGKTRTLSSDVLNKMLSCYPSLSVEWLVTGEGEMLKPSVQQTSYGENSPNVNGNDNHVGGCSSLDRAFAEIAAQRSLVERTLALLEKRDTQLDRVIDLLEKSINSKS